VISARAPELAALHDAEFCRRLSADFGPTPGLFSAPSPRRVFPLALRCAKRPATPRTVLIGNAAQTLHPVAGQGFNLGLRDAWELARTVVVQADSDPGSSERLKAYCSQRRLDRTATILFTDSLIRLFCNDIPLLNCARGFGLGAVSMVPWAKDFLARRMMLGARG
jgi:2-octaprenyl-6-methoxyphenol hydroxylase